MKIIRGGWLSIYSLDHIIITMFTLIITIQITILPTKTVHCNSNSSSSSSSSSGSSSSRSVIKNVVACGENEILLHNRRTCKCPFFQFNGRCMRKRYQTTINATVEQLLLQSRHLLGNEPILLTIDATNYEAMRALAAALSPLVKSAGTVVTTQVVDAMDVLVGGEPSATMEIVNASVSGVVLTLTVEFRLPDVDFFFWFVHLGTSPAPCPPFDAMDRCCRGDMGPEFLTAGVDCSSSSHYSAVGQMQRFVDAWDGQLSVEQERFTISIDLEKHKVPLVVGKKTTASSSTYSLGIGMVVFGRLAQNTESRVEIQLNNTVTSTSVGVFQYSGIEYSRLQLETCGGTPVFMHLVVKAANISAVQSVRFKVGDDNDSIWRLPDCTAKLSPWVGSKNAMMGCNVSIDSEFVDVYAPLLLDQNSSSGGNNNNNYSFGGSSSISSVTLYALLARGPVLTRVVARVDGSGVMEHCNKPVVVSSGSSSSDRKQQQQPQYTVDVLQGNRVKYSGHADFVQLTDVAALTLRVRSASASNSSYSPKMYSIDNISVVYSLVNSSVILGLMPDGKVSNELEALCDSGNVCLIETLLENGVCSTHDKCEVQGDNGVFVMPLYPWGMDSLRKEGTYTAMLMDIKQQQVDETTTTSKEEAVHNNYKNNNNTNNNTKNNNQTSSSSLIITRRLLNWLGFG